MKNKTITFILSTTLLLNACGGGGGGSSRPDARPDGSASGVVHDNILVDGDITAYDLAGNVLGLGVTDADGLYSIELISIPSQVIKIEARNGTYQEEYTDTVVELLLEDKLLAYVSYTQGGNVATAVTVYSTLAAGYAEYLMGLGVEPAKAVTDANKSISQIIGVDITKVMPVNILLPISAQPSLTSALQYSFFTAAISPLTAWISRENGQDEHDFYNSIRFARLAYDDIAYDGLLDGKGKNGLITMGVVILNEAIYRNQLALNVLIMANHKNNKTNMTPADLQLAASAFNQNNHPSFGGKLPIPLDAEKPIITNPSWTNNETLAGLITLEVDVADAVGIDTLVLTIDETNFPSESLENPIWQINTLDIEDGVYNITITATNFAGGIKSFQRGIIIANAGITVSNLVPAQGQHIRGSFDFRATVTDPIAVSSVVFTLDDSLQYVPSDVNSPLQTIDTTTTLAAEGEHTFHVLGVNQGNFEDEREITFVVDNTDPEITWNFENNSLVEGDLNFSATISDNQNLATATLFFDGEKEIDFVSGTQTSVSPDYIIAQARLEEGEHTLSVEAKDKAGAIVSTSREFMVDFYNPFLEIYSTGTSNVVTGPFDLLFGASDTNAVSKIEIFKGEILIKTLAGNATSATIIPSGLEEEGLKTFKVVATDIAGKQVEKSTSRNYYHVPVNNFTGNYTRGVNEDDPYPPFVLWGNIYTFPLEGLSATTLDPATITVEKYGEGEDSAYIIRRDGYFYLQYGAVGLCGGIFGGTPVVQKARFKITVSEGDYVKSYITPRLADGGYCVE